MDDVRERVLELLPTIREHAAGAEAARRLTDEVWDALVGSGVLRALAPARHGGAELDLPAWIDLLQEVSRADGSTGWCVMTTSATSSLAWFLPEDGADEVFGDPAAVIAGTAAPQGAGEAVDGGHLVHGRWGWGSAVPHATAVVGGVLLPGGPRLAVFRAEDVRVHDTWHAAGLRATGSHEFSVDGVVVPDRRTAWPPAGRPVVEGALPLFPHFTFLALGVAAVCLGIARRAVDEIAALAADKTPAHTTVRLAEQTGAQLDLATAEARLSAAGAFLREETALCWAEAVAGRALPEGRRARLRLACSHAAAESSEVARLAFLTGGGSAVFESSVLQRCLRDAHVAGQHAIVSRRLFEVYAKVALGVPADTSRL
ncbi:acyl-CoA dehydrogenase family protein [Umezawaea beigongshangensis]|uniref:acyl-CoA dehydrogenase family protein n=1 Tax=Umezawaea beigongshangensis TaxID=2780383 RepID=UPI0018F17ED4|nr:acyl-CoA dehydrogenase family protein [Umezawaea beigongshangensis]